MKKNTQSKLYILLSDLFFINLGFFITNKIIFDSFWVDGWAYPSLFIIINLVTILSFFLSNQNLIDSSYRFRQVFYMTLEFYLVFIIIIFIYWFFIDENKYYKIHIILFFVLIFILLLISKFIAILLIRHVFKHMIINNVLVIGDSNYSKKLIDFLNKFEWLGNNKVYLNSKDQDKEDILKFVSDNSINKVYINTEDYFLSHKTNREFRDFSETNFTDFYFFSQYFEKFSVKSKYILIGDIPTFRLYQVPLDGLLANLIKRLFDIFFSSFFLIFIGSWLFPIISFFILIDSKGPVFYVQNRNGLKNKVFKCLKFRTMFYNSDKGEFRITTKNDVRITKVGHFLRKTSLDELPQFINVLIGNMSVVGPRPQAIEHNNQYQDLVDKFNSRHTVKPGITGLAQVMGYRGEIMDKADMEGRIKFDRYYIYNWSFGLDIKIIFLTVKNILFGDPKAY